MYWNPVLNMLQLPGASMSCVPLVQNRTPAGHHRSMQQKDASCPPGAPVLAYARLCLPLSFPSLVRQLCTSSAQ